MHNSPTEYTVAIATRNRADALRLSIPNFIGQNRPPQEIIVVDSSDNHSEIAALVETLTRTTKIRVKLIQGERGLTKQRNVALRETNNPIVFFPDDDSIWYPDTAEIQMEAYENDADGCVAAICAAETNTPPGGLGIESHSSYKMNRYDRLRIKAMRVTNLIENTFFQNPAATFGISQFDKYPLPNWCDQSIKKVAWMTGFRMSFRTNVIRKYGFDETLKDYSLFEDIDASFSAWKEGMVLATTNSKVYHHKSPERRDAGRKLGTTQILNKAYVVAKHSQIGDQARHNIARYGKYKTLLYRLAAKDIFSKERYLGAKLAMKFVPRFQEASAESCKVIYGEALKHCL